MRLTNSILVGILEVTDFDYFQIAYDSCGRYEKSGYTTTCNLLLEETIVCKEYKGSFHENEKAINSWIKEEINKLYPDRKIAFYYQENQKKERYRRGRHGFSDENIYSWNIMID